MYICQTDQQSIPSYTFNNNYYTSPSIFNISNQLSIICEHAGQELPIVSIMGMVKMTSKLWCSVHYICILSPACNEKSFMCTLWVNLELSPPYKCCTNILNLFYALHANFIWHCSGIYVWEVSHSYQVAALDMHDQAIIVLQRMKVLKWWARFQLKKGVVTYMKHS